MEIRLLVLALLTIAIRLFGNASVVILTGIDPRPVAAQKRLLHGASRLLPLLLRWPSPHWWRASNKMAAAPKWNNGLVRSVVGELGTPPLGRRWFDALLIHSLAIRVASIFLIP